MDSKEYFSPRQVYIGTFVGGPLAAGYYLSKNFKLMEKPALDTACKVLGVIFTIMLFGVTFQLPKDFPNTLIPIVYSAVAASIVWQWQITKEEVEAVDLYTFQSNWRVAGISLASLLLTVAGLFLVVFFVPVA